jgi:hypothetical protein
MIIRLDEKNTKNCFENGIAFEKIGELFKAAFLHKRAFPNASLKVRAITIVPKS